MKSISLTAALLASTALAPDALAFSNTVYFDTVELVQYGTTPDQVQADVGFPLNNAAYSDSQIFSAVYNFNGWTWTTRHQDQYGNPDAVWYGTLIQSHFPDSPLYKGYLVQLEPDPNNPNMADLVVMLCSDDQCTDWLFGIANDACPLDNSDHVLNVFTNPATGIVDYALDGILASTDQSYPSMQIDASTNYGGNVFTLPVAGMYYQSGCDLTFSDPNYPDVNYKTCIIGNMEEVFLYTGPYAVAPTPNIIQSFYTTSGSFIQALSLNYGVAPYGTLPTVYLGGDITRSLMVTRRGSVRRHPRSAAIRSTRADRSTG